MDREMLQRHFEQAEAHVAEGVRHIAEQQERIAKLALLGSNIDLAKELLSTFCATQAQHIQNRDRVRAELKHRQMVKRCAAHTSASSDPTN
jgi:hypothetical protein